MPQIKQINIRQIFEKASGHKITEKDMPVYKPILVGIPKPINQKEPFS